MFLQHAQYRTHTVRANLVTTEQSPHPPIGRTSSPTYPPSIDPITANIILFRMMMLLHVTVSLQAMAGQLVFPKMDAHLKSKYPPSRFAWVSCPPHFIKTIW
jgi:hypothetical protein